MNPLDALTALTQVQSPLTTAAPLPSLPTGAVSEGFNLFPANQAAAAPSSASTMVPDITSPSVSGPSTWGHLVQQLVLDVNAKQATAAQKVTDVLQGGPTPVHEAMVATEEAGLSFEFLGEMRNKIVESYQQIMQMQV